MRVRETTASRRRLGGAGPRPLRDRRQLTRHRQATGQRPRIDEVVRLFLVRPNAWRDFVVTDVVDGRPDAWRVRTRFRREDDDVRPMCVSAVLAASWRTAS